MVVVIGAVAVLLVVLATRRRSGGGGTGMSATLIVALVGLLLVVGVGGLMGARDDSGENPEEPPEVAITAPLDSTEVTSPVSVSVSATRLGANHLHVTVDGECVGTNQVIPTDDAHRHLRAGETTLTLDLAPGEHTLCLQPGDSAHRARGETDAVTILVRPA
jgi:hypothetical protein